MNHVHVWDRSPLELDIPIFSSAEMFKVNCSCGDTKIMTREELGIPKEDPAEEYFRTLEKMPEFQDPIGRTIIANARNDYRMRSRYTETYWNQREEYLKQKAMERWKSETEGTTRNWLKRLFKRRG